MGRRGHRLGFRNSVARQGQLLGWRPAVVLMVATIAIHVSAMGLFVWSNGFRLTVFLTAPKPVKPGQPKPETRVPTELARLPMHVALVDLRHVPPERRLMATLLGVGGDASLDRTHPAPGLEVTLPGDRPASRGGGEAGGAMTWTGRNDTEDLRSQMWNHPTRYQTPRQKTGHRVRSLEALVRQRKPAYKPTTDRRRRAHAGHVRGNQGTRDGRGRLAMVTHTTSRRLPSSTHKLNAESARKRLARNLGTNQPRRSNALVDRGSPSTETHRKGNASDKRTTAGLSHERDPQPFEMSKPRANGKPDGAGVAGTTKKPGVSNRGRGVGNAATHANVSRGWGRPSTHVPLEHPYFRRMYKRLDRLIRFPDDLALALEQGEVIVRFTLHANGRISGITVAKRSGFRKFDRAVVVALKRAAPFGRVPRSILRGSASMIVNAPYLFSNPLIR